MAAEHDAEDQQQDASDDFCFYCDDGGNLICCDQCPKVFHTKCVGLHKAPRGEWYCPECRRIDPSLPGASAQPMLQLASTIRNRSGGSGGGGDGGQSVLLDYANADVDEIDGFQILSFARPTGPPNAMLPQSSSSLSSQHQSHSQTGSQSTSASSSSSTKSSSSSTYSFRSSSNVIVLPSAKRPPLPTAPVPAASASSSSSSSSSLSHVSPSASHAPHANVNNGSSAATAMHIS